MTRSVCLPVLIVFVASCAPAPSSGDAGNGPGNNVGLYIDAGPPIDAGPECTSLLQEINATLSTTVSCTADSQCQVEALGCSVAGVCWAIVNANIRGALSAPIEQRATDECPPAATNCQCPPMPQELSCVQNVCVSGKAIDAGNAADAGHDAG